jgi:PKD repeat protein
VCNLQPPELRNLRPALTPSPSPPIPASPPIVRISATPVEGVAPLTVALEGSATPAPDRVIASYAWKVAGHAVQGRELAYTFDKAGTQTAELTVIDDVGARDSLIYCPASYTSTTTVRAR